MFVRRTQTRRTENGQIYFSHRLVRSERIGGKVRQRTLLNLGRHFDIPQADWPRLCVRIEELLAGQHTLIPDDSAALEQEAQRIAAQLIAREADLAGPAPGAAPEAQTVTVEVDSLELTRPRSVGVEQAGLWAMDRLGLRNCSTSGHQRPPARRRGGIDYRASGRARLGTGDAPLAAGTQRLGRVAGGRLRDHGGDATVPGLGRPDGAPGRH